MDYGSYGIGKKYLDSSNSLSLTVSFVVSPSMFIRRRLEVSFENREVDNEDN